MASTILAPGLATPVKGLEVPCPLEKQSFCPSETANSVVKARLQLRELRSDPDPNVSSWRSLDPDQGTSATLALYAAMGCSGKVLVLLVEDEPLVRIIAVESLEEAGYEVIEARDAVEALALMAARNDIGVLFTDVNMPGSLNGLELAELIHERWPDVRLVITSGRPLEREVPDDGAFLPKPYTPAEMTRAIRRSRGVV